MRRASCLNTSIIQIPAVEFFHGSGTPTPPADRLVTTGAPSETDHQVHTPARLQPGKLLDGPATLHRAVISTFSPQMGGRAHDSSRQSIGCQISIVGPALRPLLRACSRKRARFLPLDSHDTRRQPPLLSLIGCAHATPTSCICLYLTLIILFCRHCLGPLPLLHRVYDVGAERSGVLPGLPHRKG